MALAMVDMRRLQAGANTLEPQLAAHAGEMFALLQDPAIYEFENGPPVSQEWLAQRYQRLESRGPADASAHWLNWVIRLPGGSLAGYVQATVATSGEAHVAYELNSRHWRQGIGSSAVRAMLAELRSNYGVHSFVAVLKQKNLRSEALLHSLGFAPGNAQQQLRYRDEPDELVMLAPAASIARPAAPG